MKNESIKKNATSNLSADMLWWLLSIFRWWWWWQIWMQISFFCCWNSI